MKTTEAETRSRWRVVLAWEMAAWMEVSALGCVDFPMAKVNVVSGVRGSVSDGCGVHDVMRRRLGRRKDNVERREKCWC